MRIVEPRGNVRAGVVRDSEVRMLMAAKSNSDANWQFIVSDSSGQSDGGRGRVRSLEVFWNLTSHKGAHRFDSANSVSTWAVFLSSPRKRTFIRPNWRSHFA